MTQRPPKPPPPKPPRKTTDKPADPHELGDGGMGKAGAAKADAAFDVWLKRGLHQMYDEVAREPIPEALLRLIEADKNGK